MFGKKAETKNNSSVKDITLDGLKTVRVQSESYGIGYLEFKTETDVQSVICQEYGAKNEFMLVNGEQIIGVTGSVSANDGYPYSINFIIGQ